MKIYTSVTLEWNADSQQYVETASESYEYDGPLQLAFGSGSESPTTTTQETRPFSEQIPFLLELFQRARTSLDQPREFFPSSTAAGFDPATVSGQQRALDFARTGAVESTEAARGTLESHLDPGFLRPETNPALQATIDAVTRSVGRNVTERALPSIRTTAALHGGVGGSRQGIAEGLAIARGQETAGDIAASIASQGFGNALNAQTRALALAPQTIQAGTIPATIEGQVGLERQQQGQRELNSDIERFNFDQNRDIVALQHFADFITGNFGSNVEQAGPGTRTDPLMGAAGGAMAGYAATRSGWGAAIGAFIGLMGSR